MSWARIARKDFEDVIRSWKFWAVIGVSLLLMVIVSFGVATDDVDEVGQELVYQLFNNLGSQLVLPVMALIFGYMSITGERESGSLRILFGLGHDRRDVLVGKLLSRSAVMIVGTLVSAAVVAALIVVLFDSLAVGTFLAFTGLTILLALSFTGIAVGVSAATGSRARAMGAAVGSYVVFMVVWYPLVAIVHYAVEGDLAGQFPADWYLFLLLVNPLEVYKEALGGYLDQYLWGFVGWPSIVEDVPQEAMQQGGDVLLVANRAGGDPFFTADWFGVLVLLAWFVVPVAVGYWRFERADLN